MTIPASVDSPVDIFDHCLADFRKAVRSNAPFTFIAYRSLLPEREDDWYYLASKISWFVFVLFNFARISATCFSPLFIVVPFVPFVLDGIWIVYHRMHGDQMGAALPPNLVYSVEAVGFAMFSALGVLLLYRSYWGYWG